MALLQGNEKEYGFPASQPASVPILSLSLSLSLCVYVCVSLIEAGGDRTSHTTDLL